MRARKPRDGLPPTRGKGDGGGGAPPLIPPGHGGRTTVALAVGVGLAVLLLIALNAGRRRIRPWTGLGGRARGAQNAGIGQMRTDLAASRAEIAALSAAREGGAGTDIDTSAAHTADFGLGSRNGGALVSNGAVWPPPPDERPDACLLLLTHGPCLYVAAAMLHNATMVCLFVVSKV